MAESGPQEAQGDRRAVREPFRGSVTADDAPGRSGRRTGPAQLEGFWVRVGDLRVGMSVVMDGSSWAVAWLDNERLVCTVGLVSQGGMKRSVHLHSGRRLSVARRAVRPHPGCAR